MPQATDNLRIQSVKEVVSPQQVREELPMNAAAADTVIRAREGIRKILHGEEDRLLFISGPCSIHDTAAALEYADRLKPLLVKHAKDLLVVMRVYFEKPRTTVGWKGLINDPKLDNSFAINDGLRAARKLLLDLAERGIPAGTEFLDPISPQYVADLISWGAIGARTTESQVHREMASGMSCPIGFKNATDGGLQIAIDATLSGSHPHHFLGVTEAGRSAIFATAGNQDCHVILRGGSKKPNYDLESLNHAGEMMIKAGLPPRFVIDCSHANSGKKHDRQVVVAQELAQQIGAGDGRIVGIMLESNLVEGRQDLGADLSKLTYGQSVTDACMGWEDTAALFPTFAAGVRKRRVHP
jgi:3-deoxy-7-phosphoheptulonate synthase